MQQWGRRKLFPFLCFVINNWWDLIMLNHCVKSTWSQIDKTFSIQHLNILYGTDQRKKLWLQPLSYSDLPDQAGARQPCIVCWWTYRGWSTILRYYQVPIIHHHPVTLQQLIILITQHNQIFIESSVYLDNILFWTLKKNYLQILPATKFFIGNIKSATRSWRGFVIFIIEIKIN